MITFHAIRWKNFLSTGNDFTEVKLDKSKSTLIVGSNGAGKSTMLDALSFALYNKPFRKINKPQLINSLNGKGAVVEVEFSIAGARYVVVRGMKPNRFEVFKDDVILNQNADVRDYQDHLERNILKLSHRAFQQVVVLGAATYVPFMQLPAWQRREVVEDLLDIQVFSQMNLLLKDKVSKNREEQQNVKYDVDLTKERIEMQKKLLAELNSSVENQIDERKVKIEKFEKEALMIAADEESLAVEIKEMSESIEDYDGITESINRLQSIREKLQDKVNSLAKEVGFYHDNDNCPTCKQGIDHEFKDQIVSTRSEEIDNINQNMPLVEDKYKGLQNRLADILDVQKGINSKNEEMIKVRAAMRNNSARLKELGKDLEKLKSQTLVSTDDGELKRLATVLGDQETSREKLIREGVILNAASALLKDGGIKTKIIRQYVPIMNKLINKYLSAMDFFVQFEMDETFTEKIKSRHRDEFSYQSFSEGEKFRINLAILFTWRAVAKLRNSASTNLLIMDEVFDSSLDNSGTEEFMKIISDLTKDTNLFVISHKGDQLYDKFHSVIRFEKVGNFSRMVKG